MTVGELKELLDDYGDHLEVVVVYERAEDLREITYRPSEVYTDSSGPEVRVEIRVTR